MPRIGIRPAIDGRRKGVRESLETQTLEMARSVAEMLQSKLRHSNGLPVECVIPARCIGGVAESAQTAALFEREGEGLFDVRGAILGHVQQGGDPSPFDRVQATRLASESVKHLVEQAMAHVGAESEQHRHDDRHDRFDHGATPSPCASHRVTSRWRRSGWSWSRP